VERLLAIALQQRPEELHQSMGRLAEKAVDNMEKLALAIRKPVCDLTMVSEDRGEGCWSQTRWSEWPPATEFALGAGQPQFAGLACPDEAADIDSAQNGLQRPPSGRTLSRIACKDRFHFLCSRMIAQL
jgi:hypothetical protein